MKRIFIAVKTEAGPELTEMMTILKTTLVKEKIKWVDPVNIHITMAFLGDTEEKRIKHLSGMLKEKCEGFGEFEYTITGTGVFKSYRDPRVIWAGIRDLGKLTQLYNIIASVLKENDFEVADSPFRPHLTIGRIKSVTHTQYLKEVLEEYRDVDFQTVPVKEVILFESILRQEGPLYKPLGIFSL